MGRCNIYYISINIYILYLGLENTTLSNQNFISNKKIYTLIFWRGNQGNQGNRVYKLLKLQQSSVPTFGVFGSPSSPFSFWQQKYYTLFFNGFFGESSVLCNTDDSLIFYSNLRKIVLNLSISRNDSLKVQPQVIKKPP